MAELRRVGILGVGLVPFDKYEETPVEDIARPAVIAALKDAGLDRRDIDAAFAVFAGFQAGNQHYGQLSQVAVGTDFFGQFQSVQARHFDIQDGQVELFFF